MRRREFISLVGSAAWWSLAAHAQSTKHVPLIGVLDSCSAASEEAKTYDAALEAGFRGIGWIPGETVRIEHRWTGFQLDRYPAFAKELVALGPDVLVATTTATLSALRRETQTIPIVFTQVSDPVAQGFVASMARIAKPTATPVWAPQSLWRRPFRI